MALDDAKQPNIYITATSAFGLHRTSDNSGWMPGMWGPGAGPGTVWKLDAANGYAPVAFSRITLNGRENTGASLGNIAYDRWNRQLYVSDLETGMIHRLSVADGVESGRYDHGVDGRRQFIDAVSGQQKSLPQVAFNANTTALIPNCPTGVFSRTPACWNFADFRRRVWGLGVRKDAVSGEVRLYYSVWSSQGFGNADYTAAIDDEKRNSLWSVAIGQNGAFAKGSVRREFFLPDFFTDPADIRRAGKSNPVTDIAFPKCSASTSMLVSERGGVRNLGLEAENPFAAAHESRVIRYERDASGVWQVAGRYDVGFYDRKSGKPPFLRANSCGGVDFGYGYKQDWSADFEKPDQFVWMNGDALCSPKGPCFVPELGKRADGSQVHGTQGTPEFGFSELLPPAATQPYPPSGDPYPPTGPTQSFMIDTDNNVDTSGAAAMDSLTENNATMIGDIEIFQPCDAEQPPPVVEEPPVVEDPPGVEEPPVIDEPPIDEQGPDLEKTKEGPAQCIEGDICTFTITITNNGPGTWTGPLWELDTLPPGAILLNYRPQPDWLCNQVGGTQDVTCNRDWVTLAAGDSVTLEMDVLIPAGTAGQIVENCVEDIWLPSNDPNDPAVIQALEQALAGSGYVVGAIDGVLDIVTMNAISQFQFDNGLPQTGLPDATLIDILFPAGAGLPGDYNPSNDGDCHSVEIVPPPVPATPPLPDLQTYKLQTTGQCRPGGLCTFRLVYINNGPGEWTGDLVLVDTLPAGSTLVSPATSCTQAGNSVTCRYPRLITLPPNVPGWVTITARMPGNLQPGAQNCVDLAPITTANDPNAANNRHCIPIRVAQPPVPDIQAHKEQIPASCRPGGTCKFDLWFINRGPGNWTKRIRLADRLPKGVKFLSASAPWSCSQSGIYLTCRRSPVLIKPGRAVRATVTVQLPQNLEKDSENCVRIYRAPGSARDPVPQNDQHCIPIKTAQPVTDISVEKRQVGACVPGGICSFKIKFINNGPGTWSGRPRIKDVLPGSGISVSSWSPSSWSLKENSTFDHGEVTIPAGGHVELAVGLNIPEEAWSDKELENCAIIDPEEMGTADSNRGNNRHCIPIDIIKPQAPEPVRPPAHTSDIGIEKMMAPYNPAGAEGGCETGCIIRLVVTNHGSATWSGPLVVREMSLPPGTNLVRGLALSQAQQGWKCERSGRCTHPSVKLAPGQSKALDFYVALSEIPEGGHWNNCAEIVNSGDSNRANDKHCIDIPVTPPVIPVAEPSVPPNIGVSKTQTGTCPPGGNCGFVLRYTNNGSRTWTGKPRISDVMTAGGARVSNWSPNQWRCRKTQHATNCTHEQVSLQPGQSLSLQINFTMPETLKSGRQNCVIRLGPRDANPSDDRQCIPVQTAAPEPEFTPHPPGIVRPPAPVTCRRGTVRRGNHCVPIITRCPRGTYRRGNKCYRPPRVVRCPRGTYRRGNHCVRPPRVVHCPRGMTRIGSICINIPGIIDTFTRRPPRGGGRRPHPREE